VQGDIPRRLLRVEFQNVILKRQNVAEAVYQLGGRTVGERSEIRRFGERGGGA
jgi:hypothetical protein